ncbi:RnfH family protein [Variovorax sp. UMC13]|uniref:RnfH family protein n=1 Tax=Variovorax sp. UMC13 TaxID=1862326 RepID=UPI001600735C|nr:RnfH family protein [Variovorax sp. UMC13]MBB1602438.1 protein rnfH [Variovorax sp. UMC13]
MQITLVCATAPRAAIEQVLTLPEGTTVDDAMATGALPGLDRNRFTPGVWGRAVEGGHVLKDGDRLEWCRALTVDPKVARRERFQQQGARGTGLFARRREGGKQGY